jgi:hypothetical protein
MKQEPMVIEPAYGHKPRVTSRKQDREARAREKARLFRGAEHERCLHQSQQMLVKLECRLGVVMRRIESRGAKNPEATALDRERVERLRYRISMHQGAVNGRTRELELLWLK